MERVLAVWFVVQIVLPFTAPLQTCDLSDLLTRTHQHTMKLTPESTAVPTTERRPIVTLPLHASTLSAATVVGLPRELSTGLLCTLFFSLAPSPPLQQTVLRL